MRRGPLVGALLALLFVVGAAGVVAADAGPNGAAVVDATVGPEQVDDCASVATGDRQASPEGDVLGWENGCWYNDTLDIDQSDGLSEAELRAVVSRSMARVEHVRGLEFEEDVSVTIMNRTELRETVLNTTYNDTLRTFDNAKFRALFLINRSTDSIEVQEANRGASVLGFYRPATDELVLVAEDRAEATVDEGTLAHELVHAVQDQQFNLSDDRFRPDTRDEANAIDGLVEGDANLVEHRYMTLRCDDPAHPWNGTCVRPPDDGGPAGDLANIGVYFMDFQPYSDGPSFVQHLYRAGGWTAVNDAYDDPPASAEQVIHPEKYGSDQPTTVTLADETTERWSRVRPPDRPDHAVVGQSSIASMLVFPLYHGGERIVTPREWLNLTSEDEISQFDPLNYGFDAAAGWDGDRMHVYEADGSETAYVWRLVWDSPSDAEDFLASYRRVVGYWGGEAVDGSRYVIDDPDGFGGAYHVDRDGAVVTIVNAPSLDELGEVRTSLAADPTPTPTPDTPTPTPPPATGTPTDPGTEPVPGFGPGIAVLALLAGAALLFGRR